MRIDSTKYFEKDIKMLPKIVRQKLGQVMTQMLHLNSIDGISNLKQLSVKNYYRIRIMDYRIGFKLEGDVIIFLVAKHRKEVYDYFPPNK